MDLVAAAQSVKLIAALVLIAASLAALLYFKPGKEQASDYPISDLSADAVTQVKIERPGKEPVVLQASDGKWRMSAPFAARADSGQMENLLAVLSAKSSVRYPATDLRRFDLEQPALKITLNDREIAFGAINPVSGEQYIESPGYVYLISPRHARAAQAESWASRELLAEDEEPVRFEFPEFTLAKSADQWSLTPAKSELTQQDFEIWINRWRLANSIATEPAQETQGTRFKVALANGKKIPMLAVEKASKFFFVREDEKVQYQFSPEVAKPLIEPPAPAAPK